MTKDLVPAGKGKAVRLSRGQQLKCTNTHGTQVIDMWAFDRADPDWSDPFERGYNLSDPRPRTPFDTSPGEDWYRRRAH